MSCDLTCDTCTRYNDDQCLDTEGDYDITDEDVDRLIAWAAKAARLVELEAVYDHDHLRRYFGATKPIFDPQEG